MRFNMEINDILKLIEAVSEHGLTSFVLEENGSKISMKKEKEVITVTAAPAVIAPAAADARDISGTAPSGPAGYMAPAVSAAGTEMSRSESIGSDKVVTSPLVGTFYNAASPDSDAFVSVGDTVKKGQVLGIIEAMKLMNEIESEYDGVVEAVLVNNEEVVEYGQPLFRIR
jgi:acetyl-CoA carboxylase biotin carboxyl carrier protein